MFYSTSDTVTGYEIQEDFGAVEGVSFFPLTSENGRRTDPADGFAKAWKAACEVLAQNAVAVNERANAVVAVKTSLAVVPNFSYLMVAVTGMAVCVKPVESEALHDQADLSDSGEDDLDLRAFAAGRSELEEEASGSKDSDDKAKKNRDGQDEKAKKDKTAKARKAKKDKPLKDKKAKKSKDEKNSKEKKSKDEKAGQIEKSEKGQDKDKKKKKHKEEKASKGKENKAQKGRSKEADTKYSKKHSNKKG